VKPISFLTRVSALARELIGSLRYGFNHKLRRPTLMGLITEMPRLRRDEFSFRLQQLMNCYPEYGYILKLLIEQIERGREASIQEKLEQLNDEEW